MAAEDMSVALIASSQTESERQTPFRLEPFVDADSVSSFLSVPRSNLLRMTWEGFHRNWTARGCSAGCGGLSHTPRLTPTRANVRYSGKGHNRHWHGVGAMKLGCRDDSLDWKFISATLLDRLEARDSLARIYRRGLVDRLEQVGVHQQVQHTGAMEER